MTQPRRRLFYRHRKWLGSPRPVKFTEADGTQSYRVLCPIMDGDNRLGWAEPDSPQADRLRGAMLAEQLEHDASADHFGIICEDLWGANGR